MFIEGMRLEVARGTSSSDVPVWSTRRHVREIDEFGFF